MSTQNFMAETCLQQNNPQLQNSRRTEKVIQKDQCLLS